MSATIEGLEEHRIDERWAGATDELRELRRENEMLWGWLMVLVAGAPGVAAPGPRAPAGDPSIYLG